MIARRPIGLHPTQHTVGWPELLGDIDAWPRLSVEIARAVMLRRVPSRLRAEREGRLDTSIYTMYPDALEPTHIIAAKPVDDGVLLVVAWALDLGDLAMLGQLIDRDGSRAFVRRGTR